MCRRMVPAVFFLAVAAGFTGCIFESSSPTPKAGAREYAPPDSPEHLLNNLSLSLQEQELDRYLEVLAPEFHFVFFPNPGSPCSPGTWDAALDSASTANLFLDPDLLEIEADIHHGSATPATEVDMEGTWKILAGNVAFYFWMSDDVTFTTEGDPHEFFFRPGRAEDGEDPDRWFLVEWRDLSGRTGVAGLASEPAAVDAIHWWQVKCNHSGIR